MPIKKSGLILIVLSLCSVSLLVFSSNNTPTDNLPTVMPGSCSLPKCSTQLKEIKIYTPGDMVAEIMLRWAA